MIRRKYGNSTQLINSLNLENVDEPLLACITAFCSSESLDHIFPKFVNNNLEYGYFDVIKYLVKHGADTQNTALMGNLYNEDDPWMSALDYASMKESEHIIEYFQTQDRK